MNKANLIGSIAVGSGVTQEVAAKMLASFEDAVTKAIINGERVSLRNFGTFVVREHCARRRRHPATGELMDSKAFCTVRFVPSAELMFRLN
ncbi:HU family DNA-binding protein [Alicyclobacillus sp. SP_1]|uniref:HU family DNA-binding protein n=1 Tax=Alicyclobacillus sp. SP_1 TaxID=2942475 RepID=UPI0021582F70|nr:HU family DNA-binding protein [Alicyclobacillus sp. SP_1]